MQQTSMPDWFVTEDPGILTDNYEIVSSFRRAYSNGAGDREQLSGWYLELRRTGAWRKWLEPGNVKRSRAKAIREFLTTALPDGCGADLKAMEILLQGTPAYYPFMNDTRAESGGANNPEGKNQHSEVKCDIITLDQPKPDKPPTGTSTSYAFRRLRNHPEMLARVLAGELSPHAALVELGLRQRQITIPADPKGAARRLLLHFDGERLTALIQHLIRKG